MPKAGKYDYPAVELDDAIERVTKLQDIAKQDVIKREVAADILGMKTSSGWFHTLISSISMYGLIDTGEGSVRITDLAKHIIFGNDDERADAKSRAAKKIELFSELANQYGENPSDEQIRIFLKQKAYVDIAEVQGLSEKISKLFKSTAHYLTPMNKSRVVPAEAKLVTSEAQEQNRDEGKSPSKDIPPSNVEKFEMSDDFGIWVKKDTASIEFLKSQIGVLKAWLEHVEKKLPKEKGETVEAK